MALRAKLRGRVGAARQAYGARWRCAPSLGGALALRAKLRGRSLRSLMAELCCCHKASEAAAP